MLVKPDLKIRISECTDWYELSEFGQITSQPAFLNWFNPLFTHMIRKLLRMWFILNKKTSTKHLEVPKYWFSFLCKSFIKLTRSCKFRCLQIYTPAQLVIREGLQPACLEKRLRCPLGCARLLRNRNSHSRCGFQAPWILFGISLSIDRWTEGGREEKRKREGQREGEWEGVRPVTMFVPFNSVLEDYF